jgi:hypothetical protein
MSWRTGSTLFWRIRPDIDATVPHDDFRHAFLCKLVELFLQFDVDPQDMRGRNAEIDRVMDVVDPELE